MVFFFLMIRRPPRSTRTDTLFPTRRSSDLPERSAATFRDIDGRRHAVPGDWAVPHADGTITLLGRGSGCINTGGEKVRSEEHTSELQSLMRISYAVFCLKKKKNTNYTEQRDVITTSNTTRLQTQQHT